MSKMLRILSLVAIVSIFNQGIAFAQAAPAASAAQSAASASGDLQEILVTAERRSESLQKVPATINVTSAKEMQSANITNTLEYGQLVPGVQFAVLGNYTQPVIRGISTQVVGVGIPANVALYIDGVYIAAQDAYNFDFVDVDSIETLKGPQGTLYGRNATGGAILVTTKTPSFAFGGTASIGYGSFNDQMAQFYVTGPITDTLAFNLAGMHKTSNGYLRNITTGSELGGTETEAVRGKLLFKPSDTVQFVLGFDHSYHSDAIGYDDSTYKGNTIARHTPGTIIASTPYEVSLFLNPKDQTTQDGGSLHGTFELQGMTFSSITAFRRLTNYTLADNDYSSLGLNRNERWASETTISQEFNLASTTPGPLTWIAGAQISSDNAKNDPFLSNGVPLVSNQTVDNAVSAFFDTTYAITSQLFVLGGVRYSYETETFNGAFLNVVKPNVGGSIAAQKWTPRYSIRYEPTEDVNVYATYNKGFKSGGYNSHSANPTDARGNAVAFEPETIDAYEIGAKMRFSHTVALDLSTYYYNYRNEQVAAATVIHGVATTQVFNAASAKIYGAEGELRLQPVENLSAQVGLAYTHDRFTSFPNALLSYPAPGGGNVQIVGDAAGNRLPRVPDFTASVAAQYQHAIGSLGTAFLSGNAFYSKGFDADFANRVRQTAYEVVNAQLGYSPPDNRFKVSIYSKNITDKTYALLMNSSTYGDVITYAPPRTYGIQVDVNF
jgi:iron complex outermembrane receptor protein